MHKACCGVIVVSALYAAIKLCQIGGFCLQVWLSPWQVSHVLSIVSFVESTLNRVVGPVPGVPPATPITMATSPDQSVPTGLAASAMKTQLKLTLSVEISLVSILCLVSCSGMHLACETFSVYRVQFCMIGFDTGLDRLNLRSWLHW